MIDTLGHMDLVPNVKANTDLIEAFICLAINTCQATLMPNSLGSGYIYNRPLDNIKVEPQGLTVEILDI